MRDLRTMAREKQGIQPSFMIKCSRNSLPQSSMISYTYNRINTFNSDEVIFGLFCEANWCKKKKSNLIVIRSDEELALTESPIPLSPPKQMSYFDC